MTTVIEEGTDPVNKECMRWEMLILNQSHITGQYLGMELRIFI